MQFLCSHSGEPVRKGYREECRSCGSFWDTGALLGAFPYGDDYPQRRKHLDPVVGRCKARSLRSWLRSVGVGLQGLRVCEVGYGGGFCVKYALEAGARVWGIEAVEADRENATRLGVPKEALLAFAALPERLPEPMDLWLFLDSFEHLPEPAAFLHWVALNSAEDAHILLVAPRADSWSRRLMGSWWPHKLPDHRFHWSEVGMRLLFANAGFRHARSFFPIKYITLEMIVVHFLNHRGYDMPLLRRMMEIAPLRGLTVPCNFGQMGLFFRKERA